MTNKEFYFNKLLAVALENACGTFHRVVHGKNCGGKNCEDCEFSSVESIENWLNAEHVKPEPPMLENGDGLKPGDWIMVRDCEAQSFVKRQFLYFYGNRFYCARKDLTPLDNQTEWYMQARLPEDGE